jgi:hypothetical protein
LTVHDLPAGPRPIAPREPEPWECCQNGCEPCVYDGYFESLARYEQALAEWRQRGGKDNS